MICLFLIRYLKSFKRKNENYHNDWLKKKIILINNLNYYLFTANVQHIMLN